MLKGNTANGSTCQAAGRETQTTTLEVHSVPPGPWLEVVGHWDMLPVVNFQVAK